MNDIFIYIYLIFLSDKNYVLHTFTLYLYNIPCTQHTIRLLRRLRLRLTTATVQLANPKKEKGLYEESLRHVNVKPRFCHRYMLILSHARTHGNGRHLNLTRPGGG